MANSWISNNIDSLGTKDAAKAIVPSPSPVQQAQTSAPVSAPQASSFPAKQAQPSLGDTVGKAAGNTFKTAVDIATAPTRVAMAGLGKFADIASRPIQAYGTALKRTREVAEANRGTGLEGAITKGLPAFWGGLKEGFSGESKVTPGGYATSTFMKDANPIVKAGVGFGIDLFQDPLNAMAGPARSGVTALSKVPTIAGIGTKIGQAASKATEVARSVPQVAKALETFNPYFRNPEAGKIITAGEEALRGRIGKLQTMVIDATKGLTQAEQARVGQILEGGIVANPESKLGKIANQFKVLAEKVGQEAVDKGVLSKESFDALKGNYMHHMWLSALEKPSGLSTGGNGVLKMADLAMTKARKGSSGYVQQFAAPVLKSMGGEIHNIETAKVFENLAQRFGVSTADPAKITELAQKGYKMVEGLPASKGGKIFNGLLMPGEVVDYITNKFIPKNPTGLEKITNAAMGAWKAGKTILNPAYHMRNIPSNMILSDVQTGKGLIPTAVDTVKTALNYFGKGNQKFVREAQEAGLIKNENTIKLIEDFLRKSAPGLEKKSGGVIEKVKGVLGGVKSSAEKIQQTTEEVSKLQVFSEFRKRGLSIPDAWAKAEEAIFSPYRIAKGEREIASKIVPFYSFTRQAAPFIAKNMIAHPERFTKYPKFERAIESLSQPQNEQNLPDYMKNFVRTPLKNKEGNQYYANPGYIYPWGNMMNEGGNSDGLNLPLGLSFNPLINEIAAQSTGVDPYFQTPFIKKTDSMADQWKARAAHAYRTLAPTALLSGEKIVNAALGKKDYVGRTREPGVVAAGEIGGVKLYPFDSKAEAKNKNINRSVIEKETRSAINSTMRDQRLSPQEKKDKIASLKARMAERLK